jgi:hypothetical protein
MVITRLPARNRPYADHRSPPAGEYIHRQLNSGGFTLRGGASTYWASHLPWVLLGIRAATKGPREQSPAELLYSSKLVLPAEHVAAADPLPSDRFQTDRRLAVDGWSKKRPAMTTELHHGATKAATPCAFPTIFSLLTSSWSAMAQPGRHWRPSTWTSKLCWSGHPDSSVCSQWGNQVQAISTHGFKGQCHEIF